jgi:hypothetical protein
MEAYCWNIGITRPSLILIYVQGIFGKNQNSSGWPTESKAFELGEVKVIGTSGFRQPNDQSPGATPRIERIDHCRWEAIYFRCSNRRQGSAMAQRSKRATRKGKQKRGRTPKKETAKRAASKTVPKKRAGKTKPRTAKKAAARKLRPRKQQGEAPAEGQTTGIATTLAQYLVDHGVAYDLVSHPHTVTASASAAASRVAPDTFAKAIVLKHRDGFMLAVLPASRHIQFEELRRLLNGDVDMASEEQIGTLFPDCERGAVPALGPA